MVFDPKSHLIQLPRKVKDRQTGQYVTVHDDYLEVKWRVLMFRERYPHGRITTEEIQVDLDRGYARYKAVVEDGDGGQATGYGTETQADFMDFCERAETRAIGRALALAGFGTAFVSVDLTEGEHVADAPVATLVGTTTAQSSGDRSTGEPVVDDTTPVVSPNGDPRPQTIPLEAGLPCGGVVITDLKPGQLAMLLSKTASLVHAEGDRWVPLLAALQGEKARRQEPGRIHLVEPAPEGTTAPTLEPTPPAADDRQRWGALSRRSMRAGLAPTVWESLRAGDYASAERVIVALEAVPANGTGDDHGG